ncbi:alpha-hydroxy acid oxidase [Alteraurantiacibacter aquimixticola]|uniref:Alpha-hydroxy-acid oxidizing protein n=1 Tax=Alteraurantiacibacter aquimixticola TaxID=2489173 RepID=A0A4T3F5C5_9SPHN|nr:alpha-hydroxy acid oxidase [Alteraurantiacibacter aquimixticola]TIX50026.1 alpha-hydroxy-acid oxidizing protein [Alteraurantiacibacter aquimixticola]
MGADLGCWNIADLRAKARRRLPKGVWEYLERGVEDETGMARNRDAFNALTFVPRVGRKVDAVDTSCTIFGKPSAMPLAIAPTGAAGIMWHKGDIHLARAAAGHGLPFTISSASTMDVEQVVAAGGNQWFQLYMWQDRELSYGVLERAHALGCEALFVTLDLPVAPNREYLYHNGFGMPFGLNRRNGTDMLLHPRWLAGVIGRYMLDGGIPAQANLPKKLKHSVARGAKPGALFKQDDLDWAGLAVLREKWPGKLVLKGVLHPDDAKQALAMGADGIVVSNHGARSLDGAIASIDALPAIVEAVGGRMTVFLDSGVRRGSDVVKALALGADAVMVGRATLYGLAAAGEAGVTRALELLQAETARVMAMLGLASIAEIGPEALRKE